MNFQIVLGDGEDGVLVIVRNQGAIDSLQRLVGRFLKVTIRAFSVKNGTVMSDTSSQFEFDTEVNLFLLIVYFL